MCDIDIYEYAMESAQFEIDNGHDEFIPIYEVAEANANKENDNWLRKIKIKIATFCKSIISKAKMLISKIGNLARIKKAKDAYQKLSKDHLLKSMNISGKQKEIEELNFLDKKLNSDIISISKIIEKLAKDPSFAKEDKDFEKISFGSRESAKDKTAELGYISYVEIKFYLLASVRHANNLNASIKNLDNARSKLKSEGYSGSQIRLAITSAYNALTRYLRKYLSLIMQIYKDFYDNATIKATTTRASDEMRYDVDKQMKETADKMNKIFGKNKNTEKSSNKKSVNVDDINSGKVNLDDVMNDPNATISF